MGTDELESNPKSEREAAEVSEELLEWLQEPKEEDIVEISLRRLEKRLREILGDRYKGRPKELKEKT